VAAARATATWRLLLEIAFVWRQEGHAIVRAPVRTVLSGGFRFPAYWAYLVEWGGRYQGPSE